MVNAVLDEAVKQAQESALPRGLHWRGGVLWISKKIDGKRFQISTGCKSIEGGRAAYEGFLNEHGRKMPTAGSGRRLVIDRVKLPKGLYWKGSVIWLSRVVKGKHYNISTGADNVALAKKFLEDFNLKAFKHEKLGVKSRAKITFEALANRYLQQGSINGLRAKTITRYSAVRDSFQRFLTTRGLVAADVQSMSPALIEDFKEWRTTTPLNRNGHPVGDDEEADSAGAASKTLQFEVQTVGTFFKHALRLGLIDDNPVSRTKSVKVNSKLPVYLEESEITALLAAAQTFDDWARAPRKFGIVLHDILITYLKTGMRLDELRHLQWSDVDFTDMQIAIRQNKEVENLRTIKLSAEAVTSLCGMTAEHFTTLGVQQRQGLLGDWRMGKKELASLELADFDLARGVLSRKSTVCWNPKTSNRMIPIAPGLKPILERQARTSNLVFPDPIGGGLWRFKVNNLVKRCAAHAKIKKSIHTHSLRHTFATQLRKRKVPLETLKELLGHADIRDTLIYAHFSQDEANEAIPKIDFF